MSCAVISGFRYKKAPQDVCCSKIDANGPIVMLCLCLSDSDGTEGGQWIPFQLHFNEDNMKEDILLALLYSLAREVHSIRLCTMSLDSICSEV